MLERKNTRYFILDNICNNFKAKWGLFVLHIMNCFLIYKNI